MRQSARRRRVPAAKRYDAVIDVISGTAVNKPLEVTRARYDEDTGAIDTALVEAAKRKYHDQPRVKAFTEFRKTKGGEELLGHRAFVDEFNVTRTE